MGGKPIDAQSVSLVFGQGGVFQNLDSCELEILFFKREVNEQNRVNFGLKEKQSPRPATAVMKALTCIPVECG